MQARMTILGMYQYDETIFNQMIIPDRMDRERLIEKIVYDNAEFSLAYPNTNIMGVLLKNWSRENLPIWDELLDTLEYEYNPIENYDRKENWTDHRDDVSENKHESSYNSQNELIDVKESVITKETEYGRIETETRTPNTTTTTTGNLNSSMTRTYNNDQTTDTFDHTTTATESGNNTLTTTNSGTDTTTEKQAAFNESGVHTVGETDIKHGHKVVADDARGGVTTTKETGTISHNHNGNYVDKSSGGDTTTVTETGTETDATNYTGKDTESISETGGYTDTNKHTGKDTVTDIMDGDITDTHAGRVHGNIGVTTTQKMIQEQRDIVQFSVYQFISDSFKKTFCIGVY